VPFFKQAGSRKNHHEFNPVNDTQTSMFKQARCRECISFTGSASDLLKMCGELPGLILCIFVDLGTLISAFVHPDFYAGLIIVLLLCFASFLRSGCVFLGYGECHQGTR